MTSSRITTPAKNRRSLFGASLAAIAFGIVGFLFGAHKLATVALKHIVNSDSSLSYQEVSDLLPVPRKLDWNLHIIQSLWTLRDLRGAALYIITALLLAALGGAFLLILPQGYAALRQRVAARGTVGKSDAGPREAVEMGVGESIPPASVAPRRSLLLAAGLYVAFVATLAAFGSPSVSPLVLRYYHTMGTFNQDYFERVSIPSMTTSTAIWSAAGLVLYAACAAGRSLAWRAIVAACAAPLFLLAAWCQAGLGVRAAAGQHDWLPAVLTTASPYEPDRGAYGVPDGVYAGQLLAKQIKLSIGNQPSQRARPLLMILPDRVYNATQEGFTEDGLTASLESAGPVRGFLVGRNFESSLSWVAIKHLFNVSTVHFDVAGALDACMTDMERCPHLGQTGLTMRAMLFTCSAAPANLAILDRWADDRKFAHPTRESRRLMGQLYERFGETQKALAWFRRADMPKSLLARVQHEKPLFHFGRISGSLVLNGQPLAGVQVGVVPRRLNGLPIDMEPTVLRAREELVSDRHTGTFPPFHTRPFALRWISGATVTDQSGHFAITDLTEGEYTLVCTLPSSTNIDPPIDPRVTVSNRPVPLVLNYRTRDRDLGAIVIGIRK